jgi:hypothetical protein
MTSKSRKQPQQEAQQPEQPAPKRQQQGNETAGNAQRKPGPGDAPGSGESHASKPGSGREGFGRDAAQRRQCDNMTTDTSNDERGPDRNTSPSSTGRSGTDRRSAPGPDQRSSDAGSRNSTESGTELDSPDIERHGGSGRDTMTPGGREST